MYDINLKNVKKGRKFHSIFIIAGLFFAAIMIGIVVFNVLKKNSMDATVMSERVEVSSHTDSEGSTMYSAIYHYYVDGKEYTCGQGSSSSIYPSEENKLVYYDSKSPARCITEASSKTNLLLIVFLIIPGICIAVGVVGIRKVNKRVKLIEELNQRGKLVKGLPYHMENTGMVVNDVPIQRPVVEYTLSNGTTLTLRGDPRHDKKAIDGDGLVDIVIDEQNPENYYIDFEINRLAGNSQADFAINPATGQPYTNPGFNQVNNDVMSAMGNVAAQVQNQAPVTPQPTDNLGAPSQAAFETQIQNQQNINNQNNNPIL